MKIRSRTCQPSIALIAISLSTIGASAESNQIQHAVSDTAMFEISRHNEANIASVLDGNMESLVESLTDYTFPKAKRTYKMKVRVSKKTKGRPTEYGNYLF